jgi:uncharacterized repeat protein (TIGR03803 family)
MTYTHRIFFIFFLVLFILNVQSQILYWGLTSKGGQYNVGTIFFTDRYGNEQNTVHSFKYGEGDSPIGNMIFASDENLYGTTPGGNTDYGVIFQFDDNLLQYQKMFEFNGGTEGFQPTGQLVNHSNGKLYGMTRNGGEDLSGVIFEYVPGASEISVKKYFTGLDGAYPECGLTIGANGLLYGLTSYGGEFDAGVLFVFDPENEDYEKLYDFVPLHGMTPVSNLLKASNGRLYGVTPKGGAFNAGVLFEYDITSETYTKLVDFDGQNAGSEPAGSLIEADNGLLYGMAMKNEISGSDSYGTIYSYDITNFKINKLFIFDGLNGANPTGGLIEMEAGKLAGVTDKGGAADEGVRFEFDITNNAYIKKLDFNGENGSQPIYGSLLKVYYMDIAEEQLYHNVEIYPNPANNYILINFNNEIESFEYILLNMVGKLIKKNTVKGKQVQIITEEIPSGTYLLQIKSNGATFSKKIIIR